MTIYNCGVGNCGNGNCIHKKLEYNCPYCGASMIEVTTTGHIFCSGLEMTCGYEIDAVRPSE